MRNFFLVTICLLFHSLGHSQEKTHSISGYVSELSGNRIENVNIQILEYGRTITSDKTGKFLITDLPEGTFNIKFNAIGFHQHQEKVEVKDYTVDLGVINLTALTYLLQEIKVGARIGSSTSLHSERVDKHFIARNNQGSLMQTLSRLPGISNIGIGSGQSKPLIRGMGFNRVVVVDKGVKHEGQQWGVDHGLEVDQFAIGEIEILRGATSFLYGSDAIGGVIDIKPLPAPTANTLGGSFNFLGKTNNGLYGTSVNIYGRKQKWFFDSRFTYQDYGDYRVPTDRVYIYDFAVELHNNRVRNTAGRERGIHFNVGYLNGDFQNVLYVSNVFNSSGFFANAHGLEPRNVNREVHDASWRDILLPKQEVNHFKVVNRSTYQNGIQQWEMELGYQRNFRQEFSQYTNHGYMPAVYPEEMQSTIPIDLERAYDKSIYSANIKNKITIGDHQLSVGLNSEYQDNSINGWTFLVPAFKQTVAGVFVYDRFRLNDKLLLDGALRYDYGHNRMYEYRDWFETPVTENGTTRYEYIIRANDLTRQFHSFVWSLGANYELAPFLLKANIGKSFRMPITKEFGANGINYHYYSYERGNPDLSPEESYQIDLNFGWTNERWSAQINPFYNYFPNYIYLNPTPHHLPGPAAGNQLFEYEQSRVMRYGGEITVQYNILPTLSAEVFGEFLYAEQLSGEKKGFTLPFSPPASVLFNLTWSPDPKGPLKDSYFSVDYRVTAKQENIVPPEKMTDGYQLVNLQVGKKFALYDQPLSVNLQIQNLFDTKYMNHTSFYRLIELPELGRNVVLSINIPFGIKK